MLYRQSSASFTSGNFKVFSSNENPQVPAIHLSNKNFSFAHRDVQLQIYDSGLCVRTMAWLVVGPPLASMPLEYRNEWVWRSWKKANLLAWRVAGWFVAEDIEAISISWSWLQEGTIGKHNTQNTNSTEDEDTTWCLCIIWFWACIEEAWRTLLFHEAKKQSSWRQIRAQHFAMKVLLPPKIPNLLISHPNTL